MRKIIILIALIASCFSSYAQVQLVNPFRSSATGQPQRVVQDKYLRAVSSLWLPYLNSTTPSVVTLDSAGSNVWLLSNGNLAVSKGLGTGFFQYTSSESDALVYQTLANLQTNLTASATKYPSVNAVNTGLALKANIASPTFTGTLSAAGIVMEQGSALRTTTSVGFMNSTTGGGAYPFLTNSNLIIQGRGNSNADIVFASGATPTIRAYFSGATGNFHIGYTTGADAGFKMAVNGTLKVVGKSNITVAEYADNAAALVGGLVVGDVYRSGDTLKIVH